jgi:hypothetical protein
MLLLEFHTNTLVDNLSFRLKVNNNNNNNNNNSISKKKFILNGLVYVSG